MSWTWDEEMSLYGAPKPIRDSLDYLAKRLGMASTSDADLLISGWPGVVGSVGASHSVPVALKDGILRVEVDGPHWVSQLSWASQGIVDDLNTLLGKVLVTRLDFRVGQAQR